MARAEPAPADISAAKQAFESAVGLEGGRHWAEAALKLRQAIAVKDTPGLRFHLAHCEVEQGHLVEASLEYNRASELIRQGAKAPDVQKLLSPASDELKARIPLLTVELPDDLRAPSASIDGSPYPLSELALGSPLNPGRHLLRISAAGRRPFEQVVVLNEREPVLVRPQLALAPPPSTPGTADAPPETRTLPAPATRDHRASPAKLYWLIGESVLTVAGLGLGIGARLAASSANDRVARAQQRIDAVAPNDGSACGRAELSGACEDLHSAINQHDHAIVLSDVGFISAGVGAAALVTTWLVYPDSSHRSSGLQVRPVAGFGHIGLVGRF